ncbi:MAG: immunoglobulin domain-containing protein [Nibricoccus sp.]
MTSFLRRLALAFSTLTATLVSSHAGTVFEDTFGTSTVNSASPSAPSASATSYQLFSSKAWSPAPSIGTNSLKFGIAATTSGHIEVESLFSATPVALTNTGDNIQLTVTFTNTSGLLTQAGTLGFGLYNSGGVAPLAAGLNGTATSSTTATTGGAQGWLGYNARIAYSGGSHVIATRPAQSITTANNQDLVTNGSSSQSYANSVTVGTQSGSTVALTAGNQYTLTLKLTLSAASTYQIESALYSGATATGTAIYSQTASASAANFLTSSFDSLALGWRATANTSATTIDINSITVTSSTVGGPTLPTITAHPAGQTVTAPASVSLSVTATGATSYQWKKDTNNISGATSATYTINPSATTDSGSYTVVVTNAAGSVTSNAATVTVNAAAVAPAITTQPSGATVTAGSPASLTVVASGTAPLSYQWQKDISGTFTNVSGATSATLSFASAASGDAGSYRVIVTNSVSSVTSNAVTLTVNSAPAVTAPAITTQPSSLTLAAGNSATFTVAASGTAPFTFQWKKDGADISGATSASYNIASITAGDAGSYTVTVTNSAGTATSNAATLTIGASLPTGTLKVDINREGKNSTGTTATGYVQWTTDPNAGTTAAGTTPITQTFTTSLPNSTGGTVTIALAQSAASQTAGGTGLTYTYYATGTTTEGQKLASDGITVAPAVANAGGEIQMTLTGLSQGTHSLLTYHNAGDSPVALVSMAPIKVSVNGSYVTSVTPSIRATDVATPTSYVTFTVTGPSDVTTVLFAADTTSSATTKNVVINGFELNTSNATKIAQNPAPVDGDEHVDADSSSITLTWTAAASGASLSRDVYFGTSQSAVTTATRTSPEFKGNQTALSYTATGISGYLTYYWRIDEVDASGTTKGTVWMFRPRQLAFPGAEGYGRYARGGRGGKVVHVTSLADYSSSQSPIPGTFRYAVEQETGPRTIVFDISGLITLQDDIVIGSTQRYITIAGQTAPGKGITIKRQLFGLSGASDVVVRYIRVLVGKESGETQNATGISGSNYVIMDHCSIGWGIDEGLSTRSGKNLTFQRCSLSEALNVAGHQNYPAGTAHGYAASVGGDIASLHHNLLAHNEGRNWSMAGGLDGNGYYAGRLDIFNNVVYNWGGRTTDGGAHEVNFVNNYYKRGPANGITTLLNPDYGGFPGTQQYYMVGNVLQNGATTVTDQNALLSIGTESGGTLPQNSTPPYSALVNAPFFPSYATIHSASDAYKQVLSDVGCNQPQIDDRDLRIINETLNGTYTYTGSVSGKKGLPDTTADMGGWENYPEISRPAGWDSDGDGMPDWWETIKGFNKNSAAGDFSESNADPDNNNYTNLDDYLNWLATPHTQVAKNGSVQIDISALTRGYTASPVRVVSAPQNGTVTLAGDGKTATFTPTANFTGLASFTYAVTDSASSSLTGTVNIQVLATEALPVITTQPAAQTITAGATATLTVTATGATSYQWKKAGTAVTGATTATLTIANAQTTDSGSYTIDVTNSAGTVTSNAATLTVNAAPAVVAPTITTQPVSQTVTAGTSVSLTVAASGTAPFTYQWKKAGLAITGAASATYTIASPQTSDSGSYTVDVTNSAGTATSNAATLTVNAAIVAPTITTQPAAQTVTIGASATFSVTASGTATLTYQWQKDTVNIAGATAATYTIATTQISHIGQYRVVVTNSGGSATSNAVALTLTPPAFTAPAPNGYAAAATGGGSATPVLVTTASELKAQAESSSAAVITIGGSISLTGLSPSTINVKSNKTIQGLNNSATIVGQLNIGANVSNVIIRGLHISNPSGGTPLAIAGASNVFITHCTFFDAVDHLVTVTTGADNVTLAWNEFYFSSSSITPRRGLQIGADTGETKPLRVTLHHNWWSDLVDQRMPVTTYGQVHQYSDYFKPAAGTPNTAATSVLANAQFLSERNVYQNIVTPLTKSSGGLIRVLDNTYTSTTGTAADSGTDTVFVPAYAYTTSKNADLAATLDQYAGNTTGAASTEPATTSASIAGPSGAVTAGGSSRSTVAAPSAARPRTSGASTMFRYPAPPPRRIRSPTPRPLTAALTPSRSRSTPMAPRS